MIGMSKKTKINDFEAKLDLGDFLAELADEARNMVVEKSPKKTGKYAKGWEVEINDNTARIYQPDEEKASITWLLEKGHLSKDGKRVSPIPHIEPAKKWVEDNYEHYANKIKIGTKK